MFCLPVYPTSHHSRQDFARGLLFVDNIHRSLLLKVYFDWSEHWKCLSYKHNVNLNHDWFGRDPLKIRIDDWERNFRRVMILSCDGTVCKIYSNAQKPRETFSKKATEKLFQTKVLWKRFTYRILMKYFLTFSRITNFIIFLE